jgi:asparagine synthase (glutamine-hydrolysing)
MCGIAGILSSDPRLITREVGLAMVEAIRHRGPDRQDAWVGEGVVLAHARLSILDLSEAGNQPMVSPSGRHVLVFNGEIYNHQELRAELEALGETFVGHSDTEVLLRLFERDGVACLSRLNGIFAFAIWDMREQVLTLARDRFGTKPLYVRRDAGDLWFGSEIKAIQAAGGAQLRLRRRGLPEFMYYGVVSGCQTLFEGIKRVEPGGYMRLSLRGQGGPCGEYWMPQDVAPSDLCLDEAVLETRRLLEQAVQRQLMADVPLGVFLSGGIDSTAVATFASRHYSGKLRTYSVGFDYDQGVNELPRAARTAKSLGTEHHEFHIKAEGLPAVIEDLVRHHDEPFSEGANIPLYLLCRELSGSVKVVLQGDGGDELFAGYRRYALLEREQLLRRLCQLLTFAHIPLPIRQRRMVEALAAPDDGLRMALLMSLETRTPDPLRLLSPRLRFEVAAVDPFARHRDLNERFAYLDPVQRMMFADTQALLPDLYLEKVDKPTMAFGIESRVPFLDNDLVDFALSLPASMKVRGGSKKFLLRRALRGIIPDEVLDGPKTGFGVPYVAWIRGPLHDYARERILSAATGTDPWLDETAVTHALDGLRDRGTDGFLLWKCLNLAIWKQQQNL